MNCSPPGLSVHGILQARTLQWVAISSSRGSSLEPVSLKSPVLALAGRFFPTGATLTGSCQFSIPTTAQRLDRPPLPHSPTPAPPGLIRVMVATSYLLSCMMVAGRGPQHDADGGGELWKSALPSHPQVTEGGLWSWPWEGWQHQPCVPGRGSASYPPA